MINRREFAVAGAGLVALAPFGALAAGDEDARLALLIDTFFQEDLRQRPEQATQLGLDKGANADLKSQLSDASAAGKLPSRRRRAQHQGRRDGDPLADAGAAQARDRRDR